MVQRNIFIGLIMVGLICTILLYRKQSEVQHELVCHTNSSPYSLRDVLQLNQVEISESLQDYEFSPGKTLNDYLINVGGTPLRSIIVSTWRSGSSFLGEVLNTVPATFYHYEPLQDYGANQIHGPPFAERAVSNIRHLLNCNYLPLAHYLQYDKLYSRFLKRNTRFWRLCEILPQYCYNSTFLSQVCRFYPFQAMKTVRLRLNLVDQLLSDKRLNIKVLLLVRDPRASIHSRRQLHWCIGHRYCDRPNLLCADMVSDYNAAKKLKKKYPHTFRAIRYEELSLDPYTQIRSIFQFFGLFFHRSVINFLDTHTKNDRGDNFSTYRDSKTTPFHWKIKLNFSAVQDIQAQCKEAMKLWGYNRAINETHLREFQSLTDYVIN